MTDKITNGSNQYQSGIDNLNELAKAADDNAAIISRAFDRVGNDISKSLSVAAKSGEFSVKSLAQAVLRDLSNIAINQYVNKPINDALGAVMSSIPSFGARAGGGVVNNGGAYLVGENGPELFVPRGGGTIQNEIGNPINITINMAQGGNLSDVKRSANQISNALARAVNKGRGL